MFSAIWWLEHCECNGGGGLDRGHLPSLRWKMKLIITTHIIDDSETHVAVSPLKDPSWRMCPHDPQHESGNVVASGDDGWKGRE